MSGTPGFDNAGESSPARDSGPFEQAGSPCPRPASRLERVRSRLTRPLIVHRPSRTTVAISVILVAAIALARNAAGREVPGPTDLVVGIVAAIAAWVVARYLGKAHVRGTGLGNWLAGLAYGVGFAALVALTLSAALSLPTIRDAVLASAPRDYPRPLWLFAAFVIVPFGTVLFEELLFRGLLWQLVSRHRGEIVALWTTSVLFALWHVPGVLIGRGAAGANLGLPLALAGTLLVTFAAGLLFGFLRLRSGSLLAPVIAHTATNSLGFLALLAITY